MNEFKVGDRVKVLDSDYSRAQNYIGQIGTIDKKDYSDSRVHFSDGEYWWYSDKDLELVEESKQMKKYDMDKWLKDNNFSKSISSHRSYGNYAFSIDNLLDDSIIYSCPFQANGLQQHIFKWIDYVNTLGANLSYPDEIKEPEFDFVEYIVKSGRFTHSDGSDYIYGLVNCLNISIPDKYLIMTGRNKEFNFTKSNADALIALDKQIQSTLEGLEK